MSKTIYFSVDIEASGAIPPRSSMLSLGAAAYSPEGKMLDTFYANFQELPNSSYDPDTLAFWEANKEAHQMTRINQRDPKEAITEFVNWVNSFDSRPVFVAYPAGFDFMFVYWYMINFGLKSPFSFSALDIKSYATAVLKCDYRDATKRNFPKEWMPKTKHTHHGLDDAKEQGELFFNILKYNNSK